MKDLSISYGMLARLIVLALILWVMVGTIGGSAHVAEQSEATPLLPEALIGLLAPLLYLAALWFIADLLSLRSSDQFFGRKAIKNLRLAGGLLLGGSWFAVIAEPSLIHLLQNNFTEMTGARFAFETESAVIFVAGLLLILLAARGRSLKDQLDSFV